MDIQALKALVKPISSTRGTPDQGGLQGVGQGFFGFGCCRAPVLAHPELAGPLFEAVAKAFVLERPEAAGTADLQLFFTILGHGLKFC
jgi:hypothetical protein